MKDFRYYCHWDNSSEALKNKSEKLKILKQISLPYYPKIYDFYITNHSDIDLLYAYTMKHLKRNQIDKIIVGNLDERINLIKLLIQIIAKENKEGIYNFDIRPANLYLDKSGNLKNMDMDNFRVWNYDVELHLKIMRDFIQKNSNPAVMQNFAILLFIIKILFGRDFIDSSIKYLKYELTELMELFKQDTLIIKSLNIIEGKQEDINEVLALIQENKYKIKLKN